MADRHPVRKQRAALAFPLREVRRWVPFSAVQLKQAQCALLRTPPLAAVIVEVQWDIVPHAVPCVEGFVGAIFLKEAGFCLAEVTSAHARGSLESKGELSANSLPMDAPLVITETRCL